MNQDIFGKELARYKLERAIEEADTSKLLYDNNKLRAANNRAYYSIYYAITAILCLEPIAFKRHKDTLAYFNKNYVHTGKFPKEMGRAISKAAKIRHASDYDEFYVASREEAERQISNAGQLIGLVDEYLKDE